MSKQNILRNFKYRRLITIITAGLIINGCAFGPGPMKKFISPSEALYEEADAYFKQQNYPQAISTYEKFIKNYPTHKLVTGANLALAWTSYLMKNYNKTLKYLTQVRTQEESLKTWVEKLSADCKKKISLTKEAGAPSSLFNIPEFTREERIKIEGTVSAGNKILVNNEEVKIENGMFSKEVTLTDGENTITINITDKNNKTETKVTKVTLDRAKPPIKITSAELDDFGYVQITGQTKKGASIFAEGEALIVDKEGYFSGQIKLPYNKQIKFEAVGLAGNTSKEIFSDTDYPTKPTGLRLRSTSSNAVELDWNDNKEEDLKGYNVYYSRIGNFSDQRNNTEVIKDTRYTVSGLTSGATYTLYIRAVDKMGNESQDRSTTVTVTIP